MKLRRGLQYGLKTISFTDEGKLCISYAGHCAKGWERFYKDCKGPWQKWFKNPIFQNKSEYCNALGRRRILFIFMWHIIEY